MQYQIKNRDILNQLKSDLIGKDSHRGITLTYAWLANQFGHFGIGYILTILIYFGFQNTFRNPIETSQLIVLTIVVIFELYNFLGPLLKKTEKLKPFKPAWKNIAFDTITDVLFFSLGIFSTSLITYYISGQWISLIILLFLVYPIYYWYKTKLIQQNACYPFQSRLSQWNHEISESDRSTIHHYLSKIDNNSKGSCLVIYGPEQSVKTNLAVSLANEFSIGHKICFYTTLIKFINNLNSNSPSTIRSLWTWQNASFIVIDDVSYDCLNPNEMITPELVLEKLKNYNLENVLKDKNLIWVLGITNYGSNWNDMFQSMGILEKDIHVVNTI